MTGIVWTKAFVLETKQPSSRLGAVTRVGNALAEWKRKCRLCHADSSTVDDVQNAPLGLCAIVKMA